MNQAQNNAVEMQQASDVNETVALDISEITRREEMAEDAGICICSTWF